MTIEDNIKIKEKEKEKENPILLNIEDLKKNKTELLPLNEAFDLDKKCKKYIETVTSHRKQCSKNKALLSFKYDELTLKVTIIQIIIIIFSTTISFLESLKSHFSLNDKLFNIITILLSTSVALIMAIYRFLKYEETKENVKKALEDHVFIINKFRKTQYQLENIKNKTDSEERFDKLVENFENEIFENYISIRENFDTIFTFKDSIYYKNKYKRNLLKLEKANNEIEIIDDYKRDDINYKKKSWCIKNIFCCVKPEIDYNAFIENGKIKRTKDKHQKREELNTLLCNESPNYSKY